MTENRMTTQAQTGTQDGTRTRHQTSTQDRTGTLDQAAQRRDCYYCTKHRTGEDAPPGGWLVADGDWLVGHGPAHMSLPGTLRIESRRHFTDFADMTGAEAASFGLLLTSLYRAVRPVTGAERIHLLATMDYQPHFHAWLYPRAADDPRRGTAFLHHGFECTDAEAQAAATAIRAHLGPPAGRPTARLAAVEYRALGSSGLRISVLTMGTMTFGGTGAFAKVGSADVQEARRQVDMCLEAGVNLIDTADVYSAGQSEEIVGEVLRGRRDQVLVATKVRMPMGSGPNDAGLSRHHVVSGCEASLRRLGTDHIDLYQVHEWDGLTPLEETLEALDLLVRSGKVRYVGASNYAAWQLMKALGIADRSGLPRFVSQQIYYSLQAREAEYELIPLAIDQGLGVLVWSPLAGGLLSGKYRRDQQPPAGSRHLTDWGEPPVYDSDALYDTIEVLAGIAQERSASAAQVALAYTLGRPAITSVVIGARTADQLADNLAAAGLTLTAQERQQLDKASAPPLIYPYWHQAKTARDRLSPADLTLLGPYL